MNKTLKMYDACWGSTLVFAKLLKVDYPNLEWFREMSFPKLVTFQSYISTKKNHSPPRQGVLDEILDIRKEPSI